MKGIKLFLGKNFSGFTPLEKANGDLELLPTQTFNHIENKFLNRDRGQNSLTGFTATEVLIAIAIVSIVVMGIFTLYIGQHSGYVHQREILQLQQQMRVALNKIVKEVRMAGYDPKETNETTPDTFGIGRAWRNSIYFTSDADEDGEVDTNENYAFRLRQSARSGNRVQYSNNAKLGSSDPTTWQNLTWKSRLAPVEAVDLTFIYYDAKGAVTYGKKNIRSVKITLTEKVKLTGTVAIYHSKTLSSRVKLRNLATIPTSKTGGIEVSPYY